MNKKLNDLLALDELNMTPLLAQAGVTFSPSRRKNGFNQEMANGAVLLTQYHNQQLVGYVQYQPRGCGEFYVLSIQVHPDYRNGVVLKKLLRMAAADLTAKKVALITSSVHQGNKQSVRLHQLLGFEVQDYIDQRIKFALSQHALAKQLTKYLTINAAK